MLRQSLPAPATAIDMYLYDIALSLRCLVDLMTPAPDPEPAATAEPVELREPPPAAKRKARTRDELQAADAEAHAPDEREQ